jgi:hypothetical protein
MTDRSEAYYVWERWAVEHALTESLDVLGELFTLDPAGFDERDQDQHGLGRYASP